MHFLPSFPRNCLNDGEIRIAPLDEPIYEYEYYKLSSYCVRLNVYYINADSQINKRVS
jgi:hypothetical protein